MSASRHSIKALPRPGLRQGKSIRLLAKDVNLQHGKGVLRGAKHHKEQFACLSTDAPAAQTPFEPAPMDVPAPIPTTAPPAYPSLDQAAAEALPENIPARAPEKLGSGVLAGSASRIA
ncbi:MAG: hypothetical protein LBU32_00590 [Clostridiales bacterium]|jgi:hypothetical protein|nr:hypothetical protein [Clostridiales bacterium]